MIDRLLSIMCRCGAESISVICNASMTQVQQHLQSLISSQRLGVPINLVIQSTPSSMHSLARLAEVIPEGKVCVTTVDTIFRETDFASFIRAFERSQDGLFAVTSFVDDEKPLWVGCHPSDASVLPIVGFYDQEMEIADGALHLVSGGIYGLHTATAWPILRQCLAEGQSRMRNYQRALVRAGIALQAYPFPKIMDIDHASDITKAEEWLAGRKHRVLAISRAPEYSPNNVEKDAAIFQSTLALLKASGVEVEVMSEEQFLAMPLSQQTCYDKVLHMARRLSTLTKLQRLNIPVTNDPRGVMTTAKSRETTYMLLQAAGISVPPFWSYEPEEDEMFQCEPHLQQLLPGWVKAMRPHGAEPDDVMWVQTPLQADARVLELAAQRVPDIVVMRHEEGDLLKVYVVVGKEDLFLHTFYPQEKGYSKFGKAEQHNTLLEHIQYCSNDLRQLALDIARTLGLQVFGFDVIVRKDGSMAVIDVNDWPSFSVCREEAARAIARNV